MKTNFRNAVLMLSVLLATGVFSSAKVIPAGMLPLHIVISGKSYWDGASKSCLPREKGGCCHIWVEGMKPGPGEISGELVLLRGKILQLTVSQGKGMIREPRMKCFSEGKYTIDGPITFDPDVLSRLGMEDGYVVPAGTYPVTENGDLLTITFK